MLGSDFLDKVGLEAYYAFAGVVLVNSSGQEVTEVIPTHNDPNAPAPQYTWTQTGGTISLDQDIPFAITAGTEVAGWRGKEGSASSVDSSWNWNNGFEVGADFNTAITFSNAGTFTLEAASTYIEISETV